MPDYSRTYTSRRQSIVTALAEALRTIDGSGDFSENLSGNIEERFKFWDEVNEFPAVHLNAGSETREYQGGGYRDRFLSVNIRIYVQEENAANALERIIEDVETVIEQNSKLQYVDRNNTSQYTQQISIVSIDTDEGVLEPDGVGELILEVRY